MYACYNLSKLTGAKLYDMLMHKSTAPTRLQSCDDERKKSYLQVFSNSSHPLRCFFQRSTEVVPGIFLGSAYNSASESFDVVVNCAKECPSFADDRTSRLTLSLPMCDSKEQDVCIAEALIVLRKLSQKLKDAPQSRVLFHCFAGRSRSAFLLCLWLMKQQPNMSPSDAYNLVKSKRPCVAMNTKFYQAIEVWSKKYR